MMRIHPDALAIIQEFERVPGLFPAQPHLRAYRCPAGKPTIGWGLTTYPDGRLVDLDDPPLSGREEADRLLEGWLQAFALPVVMRCAPSDWTQEEASAMVSLLHNIGPAGFAGSTAARRWKAGDRLGAAEAIHWWNKMTDPDTKRKRVEGGLVTRRAREAALFLTRPRALVPVVEAPDSNLPSTGGVAEARPHPVAKGTAAGGATALATIGGGAAVVNEISGAARNAGDAADGLMGLDPTLLAALAMVLAAVLIGIWLWRRA